MLERIFRAALTSVLTNCRSRNAGTRSSPLAFSRTSQPQAHQANDNNRTAADLTPEQPRAERPRVTLCRFSAAVSVAFAAGAEAHKTAGARAGRGASSSAPKDRSSANELAKIREWAAANGIDVAAQGRISQQVRDAYNPAHRAFAAGRGPARHTEADPTQEKAKALRSSS